MAHSIQFVKALQHGIVACGEHFKDELHAGSMFLNGAVNLHLLAVDLHLDERVGQSDFLNAATGDYALVGHVIERIFDG